MRTLSDTPQCVFMNDEGCGVYSDRPSACRYYPVGLVNMRRSDSYEFEQNYCVVEEPHCNGHQEAQQQTIGEYRREQGLLDYDEHNRDWYELIVKKRSAGPGIGKPPKITFQFFFMASYDLDQQLTFVYDGWVLIAEYDTTTATSLRW